MAHPHGSAPPKSQRLGLREFLGVFQYSRRAVELVWTTSRLLTVIIAALTLIGGLMPAAAAWVGQKIVDAVVEGAAISAQGGVPDLQLAMGWVALEGGIMVVLSAVQKGLNVCQSLLRAMLGHRVNVLILEKALTLQLSHFEDSEFYDKLTRARREASSRPLSLVNRTFGLVQNGISLISYAALLLAFSPWAVLVLVIGGLPSFMVEAKFSGEAFRLFRWRSPEARKQMYLETVLAREDYAKEVKLYGLGPLLLQRYREIFQLVFSEDRKLTLRRGAWGFGLGLLSTAAFYGAYAWIAFAAVQGTISLGEMTMYLLVFRQGQSAVSASLSSIGGMYEDNLYLSNLYEYLDQGIEAEAGTAIEGPRPGEGVRFENVSFTYPGAKTPALSKIDLHLVPGKSLALVGENGSGKTTLIKLLTRLYEPTEGRILLDGLELSEWDPQHLRTRVGVIFQDFARYQMLVGENVGAGDVDHFSDEQRWREAAELGMADDFVQDMPAGYQTQLGRWFKDGRELSGGQWQKIALSRAFMRSQADILVLDEPTAAMDAEAEATVFEHVRNLTADRMAILISHRFSTVRSADHIVVLDHGQVIEQGDHTGLMANGGRYARLFTLQAEGYR
ncbi:ABC transporter, transmembrane region:ABC transporter [Plesiocystis pacifica SIR-1]|uniref:ABC transporter, transmembrane region:ABC transporter n=1 Tax=Plesiocystis pacifica SIR-1 TaxID=391625 RepID=A6GHP4_9BACT|nr:ABC transporter ATP-binding protein [Plesiocystis pacifica]EDM74624.1 ABC transporter, transmembrane region:ABC transporter [Plesiocystis pacifica SIR-1]